MDINSLSDMWKSLLILGSISYSCHYPQICITPNIITVKIFELSILILVAAA